MYREDADGNVVLTMSKDDFATLLWALGCFTADLYLGNQAEKAYSVVDLTDRLNEGNPRYAKYGVEAVG